MYKLKQIPEDFIVKEISDIKIEKKGKQNSRYIYVRIEKKNRNTLDVVKELSKQLKIKEKNIGFAGSKDKNAVTQQVISILNKKKEKLKRLEIDNVELEFLGYGNIPISLGDLKGNYFEIVIRNLQEGEIEHIDFVTNYFDEQRFSKNNATIGKHLVKKKFMQAVKLVDYKKCQEFLKVNPTNAIGALQSVSIRLLRMYVNAYQSYLWNKTVEQYLRKMGKVRMEVDYSLGTFVFVEEKIDGLEIPMIGWGSEELEDENGDNKIDCKELKKIISSVMKEEKVIYNDFIIKQIPELSLEGEMRKVFIDVQNLQIGKVEDDNLNEGKKKVKVIFSLGKGSYATMVVRRIVNE